MDSPPASGYNIRYLNRLSSDLDSIDYEELLKTCRRYHAELATNVGMLDIMRVGDLGVVPSRTHAKL